MPCPSSLPIRKNSSLQVEITASDTGKGIPEDKIKYIFDPLFTSKIYVPGTGLTFAKMIVQEHKGTISVESEQGKVAAFTIRLPFPSQIPSKLS